MKKVIYNKKLYAMAGICMTLLLSGCATDGYYSDYSTRADFYASPGTTSIRIYDDPFYYGDPFWRERYYGGYDYYRHPIIINRPIPVEPHQRPYLDRRPQIVRPVAPIVPQNNQHVQ